MRRLTLSAIALAALTGVALAGDLPSVKEAPTFVPPPPIFTWTGFYVGANVGLGVGTMKIDYTQFAGGGYDNYNSGGPLGGFQIGYNYQINQFVLGVEADYDFAGIQGADHWNYGANDSGFYGGQLNSLGTVRGRLGYAFLGNRALAYVTGGFAYGETKGLDDGNFFGAYNEDQSFGATGWAAGGGLEYALTNHWTVRAEYLYADLGKNAWTRENYCGGNTLCQELSAPVNVVRVGVNYKFGWPEAPVAAKY